MSQSNSLQNRSDRDPFYGWVMVGVVFILSGLAFGALGSISVFLKPLATEFAWTRAQTSLGYTAIALSSALFGVAWGFVADRFGTRWFGVIAALVMAASLFMLSKQTSIVHFYAFYFIYGAFGNALVGSPLFANVAYWFRQQPGLAIGITAAGGAFGQGIVPYLAGIVIESSGWRDAYMFMACGYLILALPLGFLVRESPVRLRAMQFPDDQPQTFPLKETEVLLWLSAAVLFCCNCMSVPIVHLVPLLTDAGQSLSSATSVLMVLMFSGVLGRILGGKIRRRNRATTSLSTDVPWTDRIRLVVPIHRQYGHALRTRDVLWIHILGRHVLHIDVHAHDGFAWICRSSYEHHLVLRLRRYGHGSIRRRSTVRHERKLRRFVRLRVNHGGRQFGDIRPVPLPH